MFNKISYLLCLALILLGVPVAHAEVSLNQEDDFALLVNHPEAAQLLVLKGAGPAGASPSPSDLHVQNEYHPPVAAPTAPATMSAEDEFFVFTMVIAAVAVAAGLAYFAVSGS